MRQVIFFISIIEIFFLSSCKQENTSSHREIYVRKYDINNIDNLEQFSDNLEYRIDTIEYIPSKPLGEYNYSYGKIFTDSILSLWNQASIENIKKIDPELKNNGNFVKYQILNIGNNHRTEFWRTINCFYSSMYNFEKGFYIVETSNSGERSYESFYLISPKAENEYYAHEFRFGVWDNSFMMAYLNRINRIDYAIFDSLLMELKKQNTDDNLIWGPSELTISYFYNDTIESYVNIYYGNLETITKMKNLLDGIDDNL